MPTKIFLTGVTGYIGGDIFHALQQAHPDYSYTLLVRNEERAQPVKAAYPAAKLVYGDNNTAAVLEKAAADADIVIHTAASADDIPSTTALLAGLAAAGHTPTHPGIYLHISGAGILQWRDARDKRHGEPPHADERYDDVAGIDRVLTLPDTAVHRDVDKIVLAAGAGGAAVRTAVVSPSCIVGRGRGPVGVRSMQVYDLVVFALRRGVVPRVGAGRAEWNQIHIADVADLFVRLVEAAQDPQKVGDKEIFGEHGYYFCENGAFAWGDVSQWVADELVKQGFMAVPQVKEMSMEDVVKVPEGARVGFSWGWNSKAVATRARKYLDWKPTHGGLKELIPEIVSFEAARLGIKPQAAQK